MASPKLSRCPSKDSTAAAGSTPGFKTIGSNREALRYVVQSIYKKSKCLSIDSLRKQKHPRGARRRRAGARAENGDAGIRTRVRLPIHRDIYVRIPPFCSPRPLIGRLEAPREPAVEVSPAPSRRQSRASPILATPGGPPQAGLTARWEVRSPEGRLLTQPERSCRSQVTSSRRFNECPEHLGTPPRIHRTRRNLSSP